METSWRSCAIWRDEVLQDTAKGTTAAPRGARRRPRPRPVPRSCYLLFGQFQLLLQQLIALGQAPVLLQQGLPNACC